MIKGRAVLTVLLGCVIAMAIVMFGMTGMADAGAVKISAAEFSSDGVALPGAYLKNFETGTLEGSDNGLGPCLTAPVKIPASATRVVGLTVYLTDDGTSVVGEPFFRLSGINMRTGMTTTYADSNIATGTSVLQAITVPLIIKKLTKGEKFILGTCIHKGQTLYGVKVTYR